MRVACEVPRLLQKFEKKVVAALVRRDGHRCAPLLPVPLAAAGALGAKAFDKIKGTGNLAQTIQAQKQITAMVQKLAKDGYKKALSEDKNFLAGLNVCKGDVTYKAVADIFGHSYVSPDKAIN